VCAGLEPPPWNGDARHPLLVCGPPSELVAPGGEGHAGMVCVPTSFRLTRAATGKIVEELEVPLARYPGDADLANGETWISAELTG
jgi:hypothetical protein